MLNKCNRKINAKVSEILKQSRKDIERILSLIKRLYTA